MGHYIFWSLIICSILSVVVVCINLHGQSFNKDLLKYQSCLLNCKRASFFKALYYPFLSGEYKNYKVQFGVRMISGRTASSTSYGTVFKVKMNQPIKIPIFFIFGLSLKGELHYFNGWLKYYMPDYDTAKEMHRYLQGYSTEKFFKDFDHLLDIVYKIETGQYDVRRYIKKAYPFYIVIMIAFVIFSLVMLYAKFGIAPRNF